MKTKEEIRESIILDLEKAWEEKENARYWLERLPMCGDYDVDVHEVIDNMQRHINHNDREMFEFDIDDLIEHYKINQENYELD